MADSAYDRIGVGYAPIRRPEPTFQVAIDRALDAARSVVNIGAGTGSYEPADRAITAVEPSRAMIDQRPTGSAPSIQARAESLPFPDNRFDAALAVLTVHHWNDLDAGLAEALRVARSRIVIVTIDVEALADLWLVRDYFPEALEVHAARMPPIPLLAERLPNMTVETLPVPRDCRDCFFAALWDRPRAYLDPQVRRASSVWHELSAAATERGLRELERDLDDGTWHRRNSGLEHRASLDTGLRLLTSRLL